MAKKKQQTVYSFGSSYRCAREKREYTRLVLAIGASFDVILAPSAVSDEEVTDRIKRLITQCNRRDQELILGLIDKMLDNKEEKQ